MNHLERFITVVEHQPDCVPNWELGIWGQI